MRPLQKLASETVLYGLSSVLGRVLNYLLLVPFYTSIFLPTDYGVITEWYAYAAFLQLLYTYGMETAYFRFAQKEPAAFDWTLSALLASSLVFSGLLVLLATPITVALGYSGHTRYVYYFAAILAVDTAAAIPFARLRLHKRALFFVGAKLLQIALTIALNLGLLYGCAHIAAGNSLSSLQPWVARWYDPTKRVEYVFMANLVANAAILPLLSRSFMHFRFRLPWQSLRPMLVYAFPLLLMGLAGTVNEMLSRAMLRHWLPPGFYPGQSNEAVLGIFGACYKLAIFMQLGIQAFRYAAEPFFFSQAQERNAPTLFSRVMHQFILAACFILFAVSTNLDLLGQLFLRKAAYRTALPIVPYLLLGYLLLGVYYNLSVWFKVTDKTYYGTWLTVIGAVINIVLNKLLIPQLGYWGSVWSTVAGYASMTALCYYWGQKHYPIPYRPVRQLLYLAGTMTSVYVVRSISYASMPLAVMSNLVLTVFFGGILYGLGRKKEADTFSHEE
ncbi:MAG: lipopolysaccharide biosynthesis protein [Bacteroidota bacterium]